MIHRSGGTLEHKTGIYFSFIDNGGVQDNGLWNYEKVGFRTVDENDEGFIMVCEL
jgi:hypothetical protein